MAEGVNKVILLGNLGQDPELRMTSGGRPCLNLRIATTETYLDANKVRKEKTAWHSVVIWGKRGEALSRYLAKGSRVYIEGALEYSQWDKQDGTKGYRTNVVARNVVLCGGASRSGSAPPRDDEHEESAGYSGADDEIPF
jgi:single-strand DNA-binding protein